MPVLSDFQAVIAEQLHANRRKNLFFHDREHSFVFQRTITEFLEKRTLLLQLQDTGQLETLLEQTVQQVLRTFLQSNQYLEINAAALERLREVYRQLAREWLEGTADPEVLGRQHFERLADWLETSNPFSRQLYPPGEPFIREALCAEYSPEFQMEVLGLELKQLRAPVLDVGCGEKAQLVQFLRNQGIEAEGLDRLCPADVPFLHPAGWFEFDFQAARWGTIIAHLSFTNHFHHHHLKPDGRHLDYARTYMTILDALKVGGSFHYAPALPFIEAHLPTARFTVTHSDIAGAYLRTIVQKHG